MDKITSTNKRPLKNLFDSVINRYDLINRAFSFGLDQCWRSKAAQICLKNSPKMILDLCTGTGDLAQKISLMSNEGTKIYGLDYSEGMLQVAREKNAGLDIHFKQGDAANIPFKDNTFEAITISFAFRNLTFNNPDRPRFLKEIYRVLKPQGHLVILESSIPKSRILKTLFKLYIRLYVFPLSYYLSGRQKAYKYFCHSVINYFEVEKVKELLTFFSFTKVCARPLLGGVVAIYEASKKAN